MSDSIGRQQISKQVLYGELNLEKRSIAGQKKRDRDTDELINSIPYQHKLLGD